MELVHFLRCFALKSGCCVPYISSSVHMYSHGTRASARKPARSARALSPSTLVTSIPNLHVSRKMFYLDGKHQSENRVNNKDKTPLLKMKMAHADPPGQNHPHPLAVGIYLWQLTFESSFLQTPCPLALMTPFMCCFPPASLTSSLLFLCIHDKLVITGFLPQLSAIFPLWLWDLIHSRGCGPHPRTDDAPVCAPDPSLSPAPAPRSTAYAQLYGVPHCTSIPSPLLLLPSCIPIIPQVK